MGLINFLKVAFCFFFLYFILIDAVQEFCTQKGACISVDLLESEATFANDILTYTYSKEKKLMANCHVQKDTFLKEYGIFYNYTFDIHSQWMVGDRRSNWPTGNTNITTSFDLSIDTNGTKFTCLIFLFVSKFYNEKVHIKFVYAAEEYAVTESYNKNRNDAHKENHHDMQNETNDETHNTTDTHETANTNNKTFNITHHDTTNQEKYNDTHKDNRHKSHKENLTRKTNETHNVTHHDTRDNTNVTDTHKENHSKSHNETLTINADDEKSSELGYTNKTHNESDYKGYNGSQVQEKTFFESHYWIPVVVGVILVIIIAIITTKCIILKVKRRLLKQIQDATSQMNLIKVIPDGKTEESATQHFVNGLEVIELSNQYDYCDVSHMETFRKPPTVAGGTECTTGSRKIKNVNFRYVPSRYLINNVTNELIYENCLNSAIPSQGR
ncbi:uncharacterized protein LOC112045141 [Bicyclus anynana]|uniref:Uncharacterized protein LOC112045141 n=1 Tax=Bicyclus anynana TaxID=110368 RepID=A0ABM3LIS3_BICAN|nr:uncharacterized protein LOC112045141 [Bicyclus anynana]